MSHTLLVLCLGTLLSGCIFQGKQKSAYQSKPKAPSHPSLVTAGTPRFQGGTLLLQPQPLQPLPEQLPSPTENYVPERPHENAKIEVETPDDLLRTAPQDRPTAEAPVPTYRPIYAGMANVNVTTGTASEAPDEDAFYDAIMAEFEIHPDDSRKMIEFKQLKDSLDAALVAAGYTPEQIRKFYILNYMTRKPVEDGTGAQGYNYHQLNASDPWHPWLVWREQLRVTALI